MWLKSITAMTVLMWQPRSVVHFSSVFFSIWRPGFLIGLLFMNVSLVLVINIDYFFMNFCLGTMSLTLHPVNASLFIKPEITMPTSPTPLMSRVQSLENIVDKSSLTEKWVRSVLPATRRIKEISNLGTTFPPRGITTQLTGMLGSGRIERQNKCYSEPDLTPFFNHSGRKCFQIS